MTINMTYWEVDKRTDVTAGGSKVDFEATEEQFARIEASYKTGEFVYMTEDEALADIVALFYDEAMNPAREEYGEAANLLKIVFEYPDEIKEEGEQSTRELRGEV